MTHQIETVVDVREDHTILPNVPNAVPPGPCRVVVMFQPHEPRTQPPTGNFTDGWQTFDVGLVDANETFRRENMYRDDGR